MTKKLNNYSNRYVFENNGSIKSYISFKSALKSYYNNDGGDSALYFEGKYDRWSSDSYVVTELIYDDFLNDSELKQAIEVLMGLRLHIFARLLNSNSIPTFKKYTKLIQKLYKTNNDKYNYEDEDFYKEISEKLNIS